MCVTALCIHTHKRRRRRRRKTTNDTQNKGASSRHHHHHQLYYYLFFYQYCQMSSTTPHDGASSSYDEVDLEDMEWDEALKAYTYACPCGDIFRITLEELHDGEEIARCPSCSLILTVVYDPDDLSPLVA